MKTSTAVFAVNAVRERVGLAVDYRVFNGDGVDYCKLTPLDLHPNEGFSVELHLGWRSAEAVFVPGTFSGQLITRMGECELEGKQTFNTFAIAAVSRKIKVLMRLNGNDVDALSWSDWPSQWSKFELSLKKTPIVIDPNDDAQHEHLVIELVVPIFGMAVALIGAEENDLPTTGETEGQPYQTVITRYERKKLNREACIQLKGARCTVCGFDFSEFYGPLGIGFIEVHHLKSIATLGPNYCINVATDLAPLCSNCHSMAHREDPPIPLEKLRALVEDRRRARKGEA